MFSWEESFQRGRDLASKQYYHAAIEVWTTLIETCPVRGAQLGQLYDELGKVNVRINLAHQARQDFAAAVACAPDLESRVRYEINLAMTYRRTFEYDMALRMLMQLMDESGARLPPRNRAFLHANLAVMQGLNGFYADGLQNTHISLEHFERIGMRTYHSTLYNNLGALYLYLRDYHKAEACLFTALEDETGPYLSTIAELSQLYMQQGAVEDSMAFAQKALKLVWSSIMNYDKDDIAILCLLFANLSRFIGKHETSLRLLEKSQLFYGQLCLWREWQQVQGIMDEWTSTENPPIWVSGQEYFEQIQQFIVLLDAVNAQELIHNQFSRLLDTRVVIARTLATTLNASEDEQRHLNFACRFADYGLTTVEPEVVQDPLRSQHAREQYQLHPLLSVDMLHMARLPIDVTDIIRDHHERFDGTGYPAKKSGGEIPRLAQVLAVADFYAEGVVISSKPHSTVLQEIQKHRGTFFDPVVVQAFQTSLRDNEA